MSTFHDYKIDPVILKAIDDMGFVTPSEIQAQALPILLNYHGDFIGQAQTGTGKTAAFGIPLIQRMDANDPRVQAIVLAPTRELAVQISDELKRISKYKKLKITPVYGGADIGAQLRALRQGVHIVVGTPGRVVDHLLRKSLDLQQIRHFVLDEADEMLDRGFLEEIENILSHAGKQRQIWLFSATLSAEIRAIASRYMSEPEEIRIKRNTATTENTEEHYYVVKQQNKLEALCRLIDLDPDMYAIIFCQTKIQTAEIAEQLVLKGFKAEAIHGDMNQAQREHVMRKFKSKGVRLLVATDVAARGIDVNDLTHVINYELPQQSESYIHRIGRTGRAGKTGVAITLVTPAESFKLRRIEGTTKKRMTKSVIPGIQEIMVARMNRSIEEFEEALKDPGEFEQYMVHWEKVLRQYSGDEISRGFITLLCREILEKYEDDKELNAIEALQTRERARGFRAEEVPMASFTLNAGSRDNVQTGALVGLICNMCGIQNRNIGKIFIQDQQTEFKVVEEFADRIIKRLNGITFSGKKITVRRSEGKNSEMPRNNRFPGRKSDRNRPKGRKF